MELDSDLGSMSSMDPTNATFTSCSGNSSIWEQVVPVMGSKIAADSRMDGTAMPTWSSGRPFIECSWIRVKSEWTHVGRMVGPARRRYKEIDR